MNPKAILSIFAIVAALTLATAIVSTTVIRANSAFGEQTKSRKEFVNAKGL
jgi:hypothetical protein